MTETLHEEGRALVEDIIARKKARNDVEFWKQMILFGEVFTDGHGNVIPQEPPGHWKALAELHERVQQIINKEDQLRRLAAGWSTAAPERTAPDVGTVRWSA